MRRALAAMLVFAAVARGGDAPTFHEQVEPILQRRCQACHRPDGVGPFPLMTYEQVVENAPMVEEVVEQRRMPPWHADEGVGEFANSRRLTDEERATIEAWIKAGRPKGDPAKAPAPLPAAPEWALGTPDAIVQIPRKFAVPATGVVDYQYFDVKTDFGEDKWVKAMQVKVTAPSVVHHVLIFIRYPRELGPSPEVRGGLDGFFASGLPGEELFSFAPGTAKRLPRGSTLRFQIHYTPDGTAREDLTRLGLVFAKQDEKVEREARTVALHNVRFRIPAGAPSHEVRAKYDVKKDLILGGLTPHMHVRGKTFRYLLLYPDGRHEPLLSISAWDFDWQATYRLAKPMLIPAGSKIMGIATYDNSEKNKSNPDPTREVHFGEQTWDEMMIGYLDVVDATPEEKAAWEQSRAGK